MALTALALHNAIRTYALHQRTGQSLLLARASKPDRTRPDSVSLSTTAHNTANIRKVAVSVVLHRHGNLSPSEQAALVDALEQEVARQFANQLDGEILPAQILQAFLLSLDEDSLLELIKPTVS